MLLICEGIVIDSIDYLNKGRIIKILTDKNGVVSVLIQNLKYCPGALTCFDLFSVSKFHLQKGKNFYYVLSADLLHYFLNFRKNITTLTYSTLLVDIAKHLTQDDLEFRIYPLLKKCLLFMDSSSEMCLDIANAFMIKICKISGISIRFNQYSDEKYSYIFSISDGGFIQNKPSDGDKTYFLNKTIFLYLKNLLFKSLEQIVQMHVNKEIKEKSFEVLISFLMYHYDLNELKLLDYIKYINSMKGL